MRCGTDLGNSGRECKVVGDVMPQVCFPRVYRWISSTESVMHRRLGVTCLMLVTPYTVALPLLPPSGKGVRYTVAPPNGAPCISLYYHRLDRFASLPLVT